MGVELEVVPGGFTPHVLTGLSLEGHYLTPRRRVSSTWLFYASTSLSELCTKIQNWITCLGKDAPTLG